MSALFFYLFRLFFLRSNSSRLRCISICSCCIACKRAAKPDTFWGLVLFVGIPLPGTGAWTGCLIASILNLNRKKAFYATLCGIIMASIIMMIISYGIIGNIIR